MKLTIIFVVLLIGLNAHSHQLSKDVVKRLVKEEIYKGDGRMLGVRYVDSLEFDSCNEKECVLSYSYTTSGCNWDDCFDLECSGKLVFNMETIETEEKGGQCVDL